MSQPIILKHTIFVGITGEKAIYKKRGEQEPEPGAPQEKPKRLRLLVDLSGSMYRFNGMNAIHSIRFTLRLKIFEHLKYFTFNLFSEFQVMIQGLKGRWSPV